jgi:hypothetical protein
MKKRDWKRRAKTAEHQLRETQDRAAATHRHAYALQLEADELTRELEDKRKNWAPIKIKHPYVARDAGCMYCDDPAEDPRHG